MNIRKVGQRVRLKYEIKSIAKDFSLGKIVTICQVFPGGDLIIRDNEGKSSYVGGFEVEDFPEQFS